METYVPALYATAFSLLPPLVAIVLALITKEVYFSLFLGIITGALLYANGNPLVAFKEMLFNEEGGLVASITNGSHARILIFCALLWMIVSIINRSGSARAFGKWAQKHIKSKTGAMLSTAFMGLIIFVDDGFNCMTVGSVMRPITDRFKVSRAKLAYILDSTAAPVCIIAPISCWAAAVSYSVPQEMGINGFDMFVQAIPYNLYALSTLFLLFLLIATNTDYGPMKKHEENAAKGDLFTSGEPPYDEVINAKDVKEGKISNLLLPIIVLIVTCVGGMLYTGGFFEGVPVREALADADSATGLVIGAVLTLIFTFFLYMIRRALTFKEFMSCIPAGFRSIVSAMLILILAWNLTGMTGLLGTSEFVNVAVNGFASGLQMFLPAIIFLIAVFMAFSTGTSWGTFSILIPIVCAVFQTSPQMLIISISACLAGSVCGDHCSPISDTTILSSAGAQSNHLNHTTTQLPYAMTAAAASFIGYLLMGILGYTTGNAVSLLALPVTLALLAAIVLFIRKREHKKVA
ncbi:MAG: Na+/H+ antiporter NhaC family protein [Lachnospiraceae bacterium]|nr:Na+/H+ antiporter NhaC family protein [Lachnospiraceae bacterium]